MSITYTAVKMITAAWSSWYSWRKPWYSCYLSKHHALHVNDLLSKHTMWCNKTPCCIIDHWCTLHMFSIYNASYTHVLRNDTILPCIKIVTICYRLLLYVTHDINQWLIHYNCNPSVLHHINRVTDLRCNLITVIRLYYRSYMLSIDVIY